MSGTVIELRAALEAVVPVGVECVALVRGPRPSSLWARLWDWLGLRLARRAGFTIVAAAADAPPWHHNCRCTTEVDR